MLLAASIALPFAFGCGTSDVRSRQAQDGPPLKSYPNEDFNASIVQILAHRDRYHGKKVRIEGFLHVRFEDTAIYLSKEWADRVVGSNGFWIQFDKQAFPDQKAQQFDGKYVSIEGVVNKDRRGHMSAWQGTIESVTRVFELENMEHKVSP